MRFKSGAKTQIVDQAISPRADISIEYKSKANINLTTLAARSVSSKKAALCSLSLSHTYPQREDSATRVRFK
jgi:hypothetical protein